MVLYYSMMKNEYEMLLDCEIANDVHQSNLEFRRECEELNALDKLDAGYEVE